MIPTPTQIFASFERGEIDRDEVHALMALHARELIQEMEEDHQNPAAALIESLLARRSAGRLVHRHGGRLLREILVAISEVSEFPAARYLWNAAHPDVPLHCFLRMRREPVFRVAAIKPRGEVIDVEVEHGAAGRGRGSKKTFVLKRDKLWRLRVLS
ncbi:MAG: hypothetical protein WEB53_02140 [Akkermansiaceae bacterium]